MVDQLHDLQALYSFDLERRDVDTQPAWCRAYGDKVPVLRCGEVEICRYFLDLKTLQQVLAQTAKAEE